MAEMCEERLEEKDAERNGDEPGNNCRANHNLSTLPLERRHAMLACSPGFN
jgi:hypothetical protein